MIRTQFFDVHGIKIKTISDDFDLNEYIRSNFLHFICPDDDSPPQLSVEFQGYWSTRNAPTFGPPKSRMTKRLSSELFWNNSALYWLSRRIRSRVAFRDGVLTVQGDYLERMDHTIRRVFLRNKSIRFQNYQTLMRYLIHYPLFWYFGSAKEIGVLHASAVERDGQAIIFTGLNGCGKSTLTAHLWQHKSYKLLSDNFLLFDEHQLYSFPEVVRAGKSVGDSKKVVQSFSFPVFRKYQFILSPEVISYVATPRAIFFTSIGQKTKISPISSERMMQWLMHIFHFLGEFTHNTYLEFFTPQDTPPNFSVDDWQTRTWLNLRRLIETTRCYELEIGYGQPTDETVAKVLQVVNNQ